LWVLLLNQDSNHPGESLESFYIDHTFVSNDKNERECPY
jgi:hypothetical protein